MVILYVIAFFSLFAFFQGIMMTVTGVNLSKQAKEKFKKLKEADQVVDFFTRKQIDLKRQGADIFLSDGITVSQWYMYKSVIGGVLFLIAFFVSKGLFHSDSAGVVGCLFGIIGWFFLDLFLRIENKSSNDAMMPDVCEMSRSVLYGKRGGQYIADALKDSVMVVENKRLKLALIRLKNDLDSGRAIDECLEDFELSFSNGEISAFCTVIKSLQSTGQVDEALNTLETNIQREQVGVNKRRCVVLENKTMMYVLLIAFDILAVILYCIIVKLLQMQIAF